MKMEFQRILSLATATMILLAPQASKATPICPTDTLGNVIALGSCTIGSTTFTFGPSSLSGHPIYMNGPFAGDTKYAPDASVVGFTPIASLNNVGFTLSGGFGVNGAPSTYIPTTGAIKIGNFMDAQLGYLYVNAATGSNIIGTSVDLTGASISTDVTDTSSFAYAGLNSLASYISTSGSALSTSQGYGPSTGFIGNIFIKAYDYSADPASFVGFTGATFEFALASDTPAPPPDTRKSVV